MLSDNEKLRYSELRREMCNITDAVLASIFTSDTKDYDIIEWNDLENVRYFYDFFKRHESEFG